jgi:hypothetical protein
MTSRSTTGIPKGNEHMGTSLAPRKHSRYWLLIIAAAVAAVLVAYLKSLRIPVLPAPSRPPATVDYSDLARTHAEQAARRDRDALSAFRMDVDRIMAEHTDKLRRAARRAANVASDYGSCCKLVSYLAWDKVRGGDKTEAYLNRVVKPFVAPAVGEMSKEMDAAMAGLEHDLRASTVRMARDLAAVAPGEYGRDLVAGVETIGRPDARQALRNLGLDSAGVGVSAGFDVVALCGSQLTRGLWRKIALLAGRMFGKPVATTAASMTAAVADGPLPIGDVLAIGGMAWTAYDIHSTRQGFGKEMSISLRNLVEETATDVHKQSIRHATAMVKRYREFQDAMGSRTLAMVNEGGS